ncbi:MAG: hypothetical protein IJU23_12580, partial [Proteobacteria bacterium]|nr:hypothetical protein [Pseudomonadota bacterium]
MACQSSFAKYSLFKKTKNNQSNSNHKHVWLSCIALFAITGCSLDYDWCPDDPNRIEPGICGCGAKLPDDMDSDKDGTPDCNDECPQDPLKTKPGQCGCGISDEDIRPHNGIPDCKEKACTADSCGDGQQCVEGTCKPVICKESEQLCGNECIDITQNDHCGSCDNACEVDKGEICQNKQCVCKDNQTKCDGRCVDIDNDPNYCGSCDNACAVDKGEICQNKECKLNCDSPFEKCDGHCVDLSNDSMFCGSCSTSCSEGEVCRERSCVCENDGDIFCKIGNKSVCTNPKTDTAHCGCDTSSAGMACTELPNTKTQSCDNGECAYSCQSQFADCDNDPSNGCETNLTIATTCGSCNNACIDANASTITCEEGKCVYTCKEGTEHCGDDHCFDLNTSNEHCGSCDNACHRDETCNDGICVVPLSACINEYATVTVDGKDIKAYCIRTKLELESMRAAINSGSSYPDAGNANNAYILMNNLELGTVSWTPIGNATNSFKGIFLGNGKSISGKLTTNGSNAGLFGVTTDATIRDLRLSVDLTARTNGAQKIGALVGSINTSKVINVHETGNVSDPDNVGFGSPERLGGLIGYALNSTISNCSTKTNTTFYGISSAGGMIGWADQSTIKDCSSESTIRTGQTQHYIDAVGGLLGGFNSSTISNSHASGSLDISNNTFRITPDGNAFTKNIGGLLGTIAGGKSNISNCSSSVNINAPTRTWVGGLVGRIYNDVDGKKTITDSYATGTVNCFDTCGSLVGYMENTNINNSYATGKVTARHANAAGLIGRMDNSTLDNCYATGNVEANISAGGLVLYSHQSTIKDCYVTGNVTATNMTYSEDGVCVGGAVCRTYNTILENTYATGNVSGYWNIGGLIGFEDGSTIKNCMATGNATGYGSVGGIIGAILNTSGNSTITNSLGTGNAKATAGNVGSAI